MLVAEGFQSDPQFHFAQPVDADKLVVIQLDDIALLLGHDFCHMEQLAGAVGQHDGEGEYPAAVDQPVLHQAGHGDHIHVAAGEDGHHIFALAVQMLQGGYAQKAGVFHHHFVVFHDVEEGVYQLVVFDGQELIHIFLHIGEHQVAGGTHGHAIGNGDGAGQGDDVACFHRGLHGSGARGLHADDLHIGIEQLGQSGHACRQAAAADGNQNDVHIRQRLENFIGNGALAASHVQVVEGRDIGQALFFGQFHGVVCGVVEYGTLQDDPGPVLLGAVHFHQRCGGGHDDGGFHAGHLGGVGHALGVVAGGGGDQALGLLFFRQLAGFIVSAADLVGAGDLQVFGLEIDLVAAQVGKILAVDKLGVRNHAAQNAAGFLELIQCKHACIPSSKRSDSAHSGRQFSNFL